MTNKIKKTIDRIVSITWWTLLLALFFLVFGIVSAKIKGEVPTVFGYSVVKIISPSMEKDIPVGAYVLIKDVDPEDVKQNDIICFYSDDPDIKGFPNLHRVVQPPIAVGEGYEYVTKGDNNAMEDSVTAKSDKLIGKFVTRMFWLEDLSDAVSSNGMMTFVMILFVLSIGMIVAVVVLKSKYEPEQPDQTNKQE